MAFRNESKTESLHTGIARSFHQHYCIRIQEKLGRYGSGVLHRCCVVYSTSGQSGLLGGNAQKRRGRASTNELVRASANCRANPNVLGAALRPFSAMGPLKTTFREKGSADRYDTAAA